MTGDLGLEPYEVESKLQEIFRLAHAWDCVLLLDEADIFLAQRTTTDMQRNALVSGKTFEPFETQDAQLPGSFPRLTRLKYSSVF